MTSAGAVTSLPFYGLNNAGINIGFTTRDRGEVEHGARYRGVTPDYFAAMALRLRGGRLLDDRDRSGAPGAVVVNSEVVRQVFGGDSPIGQTVTIEFGDTFTGTIVGVVDPVRHEGLLSDIEAEVYVPYAQHSPLTTVFIALRTERDPKALIPPLRAAVRTGNAGVIIEDIQPLQNLVDRSVATERLNTAMLVLLAAVALGLAWIGLYAVVAHGVRQRVREIGIRMALGAAPTHVIRHVLADGLWLTGAGIAAGLVLALPLTASITRMLVDVDPRDPVIFTAMPIALAAVALLASYVPARRASLVDPVESLRLD